MLIGLTGFLSNLVSSNKRKEPADEVPAEQSKKKRKLTSKTRKLYQAELMASCNEVGAGLHVTPESVSKLQNFIDKAIKDGFIDELDFNAKIESGHYLSKTVLFCLTDIACKRSYTYPLLEKVLKNVSLERLDFEAGNGTDTPLVKLAHLFNDWDEPSLLEFVLNNQPELFKTLNFSHWSLGLIARGVYTHNRSPELLVAILKALTPDRCNKFNPGDLQLIGLAALKVGTAQGKNHELVKLAYQFVADCLARKEREYKEYKAQNPEPNEAESDDENALNKNIDIKKFQLLTFTGCCEKGQQNLRDLIEGNTPQEPSVEGVYFGRRTHAEVTEILNKFHEQNASVPAPIASCRKV